MQSDSVIHISSVTQSCPTLCDPMDCSTPGFLSITNSQSLLKLTSIELVTPSNHLTLCRPLLLLPSILPSIKVFSNESVLCIRWSKYRSFSFSISPANDYSGLISFRMDWLDLLAVQGTLKSLLQHHSSKASILWCSAYFMVQLSHPYMTTGKTEPLSRWAFVKKVMSLFFNMLSRLVITFPVRSKCLLISWPQSPSAVILEPKKIKSVIVSIVTPSICHEVLGPDAMILVFWRLTFKPAFKLSSFTFIKRLFSSSSLSAISEKSEVVQSCPTLCNPTDCSLPCSSIHGIFQATVLEWVAISFSRGSSQPRDGTKVVSSAYLRLLIFLLEILIPLVSHPAQHFTWCEFNFIS